MTDITQKAKDFNKVLVSAKKALDSIGMKFHLHAGTSLGAYREHSFIEHDHDIDIAVFYKDANTPQKVAKIKQAMIENGFELLSKLGTLHRGHEFQFVKNDISLDIFWIYEGEYRDKKYYLISSYYGACDQLKYKTCVWGYRPYKVEKIEFLGNTYNIVPKKTLIDMYGKDWRVPKQFGYEEGITQGGYKGFLKDYYNPRPTDTKIAFCFLLYDRVIHGKIWSDFFSSDNYPVPSFNIYSHIKTVNENTQEWLKQNRVRTIKTGWCEENLVFAWIKMLEAALKDPTNQYFIILSGECIPLFTYEETYKKITSTKKSLINPDFSMHARSSGLVYADQWCILNREHAKLLIKLKTTEGGKNWIKSIRPNMEDNCPDEIYPVSWFIHHYGREQFRKEFKLKVSTYTAWYGHGEFEKSDKHTGHPIKFTNTKLQSMKKKICESGAIFARKFNKKAARNLAMTCNKSKSKRSKSKSK